MKKSWVILISIVILAVLAAIFYKVTGGAINLEPLGACLDTDGGDNKFAYGETFYQNREYIFRDECYAKGGGPINVKTWLKERLCGPGGHIETKKYHCENGCKDGVCLK